MSHPDVELSPYSFPKERGGLPHVLHSFLDERATLRGSKRKRVGSNYKRAPSNYPEFGPTTICVAPQFQ